MGTMGHVHYLQVRATDTWGKCSHVGGGGWRGTGPATGPPELQFPR